MWPEAVAPADIHIVALGYAREEIVKALSDSLYVKLSESGFDVLLDDRDVRAGVKFSDADLIGIPHRLTIGLQGLKRDVIEYNYRRETTSEISPSMFMDLMDSTS